VRDPAAEAEAGSRPSSGRACSGWPGLHADGDVVPRVTWSGGW